MESMHTDTPALTNDEIARVLFQVASLLDIFGDNPYRVRAYRRAALGVLLLPRQLVEYVSANEDLPLPGLGKSMDHRLRELVNSGNMGIYETLLEDLGEPL